MRLTFSAIRRSAVESFESGGEIRDRRRWFGQQAAWFGPAPEAQAQWEKHHDRLERRHLARVAVSPEEIGLVGCWQVIAVKRERQSLDPADPKAEPEVGYYATSLALEELDAEEISAVIRDHWSAIENGVHHRRDVSFQEDGCRVQHRVGAEMLASLRNLAIGLYELELDRGRTQAGSLRNWMKSQTFGNAHRMLRR